MGAAGKKNGAELADAKVPVDALQTGRSLPPENNEADKSQSQ